MKRAIPLGLAAFWFVTPTTHADTLRPSALVLRGPHLVPTQGGAALIWLQAPKNLVVAQVDANAHVLYRQDVELPEVDATIEGLAPLVLRDGSLAVAYLESGVKPVAAQRGVTLRRIVMRTLDERQPRLRVVAAALDDDDAEVPATLIGAGLYTAARAPAIVWIRAAPRPSPGQRGEAVVITILWDNGTATTTDLFTDSRSATQVAWLKTGAAVVGGHDAGRPYVAGPKGDQTIEVPAPAHLSGLWARGDETGPTWMATGLDALGRVFVARSDAANQASPEDPKAARDVPPLPLYDLGPLATPPVLVATGALTYLYFCLRLPGRDEIFVHRLDDLGRPDGMKIRVLGCPAGSRSLGFAAAALESGRLVVIACDRPAGPVQFVLLAAP